MMPRSYARAICFYGKSGFNKIADRRFRVGDNEYDDVVLAKSFLDIFKR